MANFQYKNSTWQDIPDYAHPDDEGSIQVVYPEATDRDGLGAPCAAVGSPHIAIQAQLMTGTGWNWWHAFFASADALTAAVSITAYNPRTGTWTKYAGTLLRPLASTVQPGTGAASTVYRDVSIIVERISVTS